MHALEENVMYNFPTIWDSFITFENTHRKRGEQLNEFVSRWKENMTLVQNAGCEYSDTLLACKLLQKANLDDLDAKSIVNEIVYAKSEMLCALLSLLENYTLELSGSDGLPTAFEKDAIIKDEFKEDLLEASAPAAHGDLKVLPEVEIKEEPSEVSHPVINVDLTELVGDHESFNESIKPQKRKKRQGRRPKRAANTEDQGNGTEEDDFASGEDFEVETKRRRGPKGPRSKGIKSPCELCGRQISVKFVKKHLEKCLRRSQGGDSMKSEENKRMQRVQCEFCGKNFAGQGPLKVHYSRCPNLDQEERTAKGYACPSNKKVTCKICNRTFARKYNYNCHLATHTGEKKYKCDLCPATFAHSSFLDSHKYRHEKGKRHQCQFCPKLFHATTGLKRHIMRMHTKERPFQCPHCSYSTVDNHHLTRHIRSHTGEAPYQCNICGKLYREKKSVKIHLGTQHDEQDERHIVRCNVPTEKVVES